VLQSLEHTCDVCGAPILTVSGVPVQARRDAMAHLARFGLGTVGRPLLEPKRRGA